MSFNIKFLFKKWNSQTVNRINISFNPIIILIKWNIDIGNSQTQKITQNPRSQTLDRKRDQFLNRYQNNYNEEENLRGYHIWTVSGKSNNIWHIWPNYCDNDEGENWKEDYIFMVCFRLSNDLCIKLSSEFSWFSWFLF